MRLQAITGHQTTQDSDAHLYVSYHPFDGPEKAITRNLAVHGLGIVTSDKHVAIATRGPLGGDWTHGLYEIPEGTLLRVFAKKHFGRNGTAAALFIRMREGAAQREIALELPVARTQSFLEVKVQGNFDILPFNDAILLGSKHPRAYMVQHSQAIVARVLRIRELTPELSPRALLRPTTVVLSPTEQRVVVQPALRRRRLLRT